VHILASSSGRRPLAAPRGGDARPHLSLSHALRAATESDADEIAALVNGFAGRGLMLPRTAEEIAIRIEDYIVAVDANGRVRACAALDEYSPSLAEVASVAVDETAQGRGLGSAVVQAVERMARLRGIRELFAMTLTSPFFDSLGYAPTTVERFPEKLVRYESLRGAGVEIVEKECVSKRLRWEEAA
jgi:amino-acid N-acetyltransferase